MLPAGLTLSNGLSPEQTLSSFTAARLWARSERTRPPDAENTGPRKLLQQDGCQRVAPSLPLVSVSPGMGRLHRSAFLPQNFLNKLRGRRGKDGYGP